MNDPGGRVPGFDAIELEREEREAKMSKQYLGDGVYIDVDRARGAIVLTAENGVCATDTIYLEGKVWQALERYMKDLIAVPLPDAEAHPSIQRPQTDLGE